MTKRSFLIRVAALWGAVVGLEASKQKAQAAPYHHPPHHWTWRHRRHVRRRYY